MSLAPLRQTTRKIAAVFAASTVAFATPAAAAQFEVFLGGDLGSFFEADATGGSITGLSLTISGVTFDTPDMGSTLPVYDPAENDINGAVSQFGSFRNSGAAGLCGPLMCILAFEDRVDLITPGNWLAFVEGSDGNFGEGVYVITPQQIPVPAGLPLILTGLAVLGVVRFRES